MECVLSDLHCLDYSHTDVEKMFFIPLTGILLQSFVRVMCPIL